MFKDIIRQTALTTDEANDVFRGRIFADNTLYGDISFISTLRALLHSRMEDGDSLCLKFGASNYTKEQVSEMSVQVASKNMFNPPRERGYIYIHQLIGANEENNKACFDKIESVFSRKRGSWASWERVEKITGFFNKQFNVLCFVNNDTKSVAVYIDTIKIPYIHYLQCAIFAFFPWYFSPEKGVTPEEMEIVNSLRETSKDKFLDCMARYSEKLDFRGYKIKKLLKGFQTKYEEVEKRHQQERIQSFIRDINTYNSHIRERLMQKNEAEIRLLGLEKRIADGVENNELMDYFLCNKKLIVEYINGDELTFGVRDYLTYFDEAQAKRAINNKGSFVYANHGTSDDKLNPEAMGKLMTAIFVDQTLKVKSCSKYTLQISGGVSPRSYEEYGAEYKDAMPNPHIDRYSCMGGYSEVINNYLKDHDYINAVEHCIASCKSLNLFDGPVMVTFVKYFYENKTKKFIELPDGTSISPVDAIDWIREVEASKTATSIKETEESGVVGE